MSEKNFEILHDLKKCAKCGRSPILTWDEDEEGYKVKHHCKVTGIGCFVGPYKTREQAIATWVLHENEAKQIASEMGGMRI